VSIPRDHQEVMASAKTFRVHTPPEIRAELEILEANLCLDRVLVLDEDIDVELTNWIPDTGSSNSQETKYYRTIDLY
jgi:hypothetical protein